MAKTSLKNKDGATSIFNHVYLIYYAFAFYCTVVGVFIYFSDRPLVHTIEFCFYALMSFAVGTYMEREYAPPAVPDKVSVVCVISIVSVIVALTYPQTVADSLQDTFDILVVSAMLDGLAVVLGIVGYRRGQRGKTAALIAAVLGGLHLFYITFII